MSKSVYDRVSVVFVDEHVSSEILASNVNDYDHEIEIETSIHVAEIKRGWTGDILFNFQGFNVDDDSGVITSTWIRNVLCARVKMNIEAGSTVIWTYCFLKD